MEALSIDGAWVFAPCIHRDDRGQLAEWYRAAEFSAEVGYPLDLKQANCSVSRRGVIRGIHFTGVPPGQARYVCCASGSILDVVVDLREGSPTFGRWDAVTIGDADRRAVFAEHGLGHAYMALSQSATVVYLSSSCYDPAAEHGVDPLDAEIGIDWPAGQDVVLSARDAAAPPLAAVRESGLLPSYPDCRAAADRLRAHAAAGTRLSRRRWRRPTSRLTPRRRRPGLTT
jgi:dTDP-4-dehydrorhamnose 3,5-epimerase